MINPLLSSQSYQLISSTNAKQIKQLSWLGRSSIRRIAWSPDGQLLAVTSSLGVWLYDLDQLGIEPILLRDPTEGAWTISFSPDGKILAVGNGWNGDIMLWSLENKGPITTLRGGEEPHWNLLFSPDSSVLVSKSGRHEGDIRIWNMTTGKAQASFTGLMSTIPDKFMFSPDSSLMVFSDGPTARLWNIRENKEEAALEKVTHFTFGIDNRVFITLYKDDKIQESKMMLTLEKLGLRAEILPEREATAIIPHPKANLVIYSDCSPYRAKTYIWDAECHHEVACLKDGKETDQGFTLNFDGSLLAYTSPEHLIRVWDINSGRKHGELKGHKWGSVDWIAFHPHKNLLASAARADKTVRVWDVNICEQKAVLEGFTSTVYGLDFSSDGTKVALSQIGDIAQIWGIEPIEQKLKVWEHGNGATGNVVFSPEGNTFAVGFSRMVNLYKTETGQKINTFRVQKENRRNRNWIKGATVAFSPDGLVLAANSYKGLVSLWYVNTGEEFAVLKCDKYIVDSFAFSPDGETLAVGIWDTVQLWNWRTAVQKAILKGRWVKTNLAFSPEGRLLAFAGERHTIKIIDVKKGKDYLSLEGHKATLQSLSFNPDGSLLASSGYDHTVRLWDIERGQELIVLPHRDISPHCLSFSPDGALFATTDNDHVKIWGMTK